MGISVVIVLHDLNIAAAYSDHIVLLNKGRIIMQGSPEQVMCKEVLEKVYHLKVHIFRNPFTGKPHIIPLSGYTASGAAAGAAAGQMYNDSAAVAASQMHNDGAGVAAGQILDGAGISAYDAVADAAL